MSNTFAKNLRAYRMLAGMTQADLAKATDTTRSSINNYEAAKSEPNFETLCLFARVLGVDITDLIQGQVPDFTRRMQVTDDESALLQAYRDADPVYRNVVLDILRSHKGVR